MDNKKQVTCFFWASNNTNWLPVTWHGRKPRWFSPVEAPGQYQVPVLHKQVTSCKIPAWLSTEDPSIEKDWICVSALFDTFLICLTFYNLTIHSYIITCYIVWMYSGINIVCLVDNCLLLYHIQTCLICLYSICLYIQGFDCTWRL